MTTQNFVLSNGHRAVMRGRDIAAVASLIVAVGFAGSAVAGPLEDGLAAFERRDYVTAMRVWRPLADQGDAVAQFNLGVMYLKGQGIAQDDVASVIWLRKAADQGNVEAQSALGNMYFLGRGVPKDYAQAAKWGRKAADQGDPAGQSLLGAMYFDGFGVP